MPVRARRPDAGVTLVEVLIGMTISGLVLTLLVGVYMALLHLNARATTFRDLGEISTVMDALTAELRLATRSDGVVIWEAETDGLRHDIVGILSTRLGSGGDSTNGDGSSAFSPIGWRYFALDLARGELRRIDHVGERGAAPPPIAGGAILARNVQSFRVTRQGNLIEVAIVAVKNGQTVRLQTAIWPRNERR